MSKLKIDPDFQGLIPPLADEELQQLEQNILAEGCRDAIKVWRGYIIDGHNRYAICEKLGIPYNVQKIPLTSKTDAKIWIAENQLGRRNITTAMRIEIAAQKAALQGHGNALRSIAKAAGVCADTVHKYMKIAGSGSAEMIEQVRSGEVKIGNAYKNLHMDTRTVETLYDFADLQYKNDPMCYKYMLSRTGWIENIYGFLIEHVSTMLDADEVCVVKKLLEVQLRALEDIVLTWEK